MSSGKTFRVLVTGSRTWDDLDAVWGALKQLADEHGSDRIVIVHGHCRKGADKLADDYGLNYGIRVERHPADWASCGPDCPPEWHRRTGSGGFSYCPGAGLRRNAEMVALGAGVALAFIRIGSRGASHCAALAERAGIPTRRFEVNS